VEAEELEGDISTFREALSRASFVVDAVFGTGLSRAIDGRNAVVLEAMQEAKRPIVAVDVPSGLDADTGARLGVAIKADLTVTFVAHKLGLLTPRGAELAGKVVVTDIGVPPPSVGQPGGSSRAARLLERSDVAALVTPRALGAHKNAAGHVVVLAGSAGHVGAAVMCAHGAFRAGAGLVTIATWPEAAAQIEGRATEVMTARLAPERLEGSLDDVLSRATVVVVGPGFGKDERAKAAVRHVLASWGGPSVVDADALAMFAGDPDVFASAKGATILTPHPGELGVLLGVSARDIEADRFLSLASCVSRARSVTLLKGAHTLVGAPGETPVVNASGTPALATAGSGDVLSGTIAAMACTLEPFEAAFVGAHLHGLGAEAWSERHGDRGLLAHEIADEYPGVMRQLLRVERA
jgi:NAD(P)H-hydrate epimerase